MTCDRDIGNTHSSDSRSSIGPLNDRYENISTNTLTSLNIIHTNCQSAINKRSEIISLIDAQKPDVLALTEFGASSAIGDSELGVEGYTLYRGNHSDGKGGPGKGVGMYVSNTLNHSAAPAMEKVVFDCSTWSFIKLADNKTLLVGVVYRSPNSTDGNNQNLLSILRTASTTRCEYLSICGDFNLPSIDWNLRRSRESENSFSSDFVEQIEEMSLYQHARESTRFRGSQNSCLDLIFTNEESMINEIRELPPLGKSDHICQRWELTVSEALFRNTTAVRFNYKRARWTEIKSEIVNYQSESSDQPSVMYDKFVAMIKETKNRHIPKCRPKSDKFRLPWMRSPKIQKQRTKQWQSWRRFKQTGLPQDYGVYKIDRNRLCNMVRTAKMKYEGQLITAMKESPNLYFGHCRRTLKTKQGVSNVIDGAGVLTVTERETAGALNEYYYTVFTKDDGRTMPPDFPLRTQETIEDVILTTEMVTERLQELKPNKAAGPDEMEGRFLKECAEEVAPLLQQIYRKSLDEGEVPRRWKEAEIVPIHKGGSKAEMANF